MFKLSVGLIYFKKSLLFLIKEANRSGITLFKFNYQKLSLIVIAKVFNNLFLF